MLLDRRELQVRQALIARLPVRLARQAQLARTEQQVLQALLVQLALIARLQARQDLLE